MDITAAKMNYDLLVKLDKEIKNCEVGLVGAVLDGGSCNEVKIAIN